MVLWFPVWSKTGISVWVWGKCLCTARRSSFSSPDFTFAIQKHSWSWHPLTWASIDARSPRTRFRELRVAERRLPRRARPRRGRFAGTGSTRATPSPAYERWGVSVRLGCSLPRVTQAAGMRDSSHFLYRVGSSYVCLIVCTFHNACIMENDKGSSI